MANNAAKKPRYTVENSTIVTCFEGFRQQLDQHHDRHERVVKLSRDITILSKRIIFNLHRFEPDHSNCDKVLKDAEAKLCGLRDNFNKIGEELNGEDRYRYHRAYTNGVQEFVEALSFYYIIKNQEIIAPNLVEEYMGSCPLLTTDYIAGLADVTGEVMRMCISSCGKGYSSLGRELRDILLQVNTGIKMCGVTNKGMLQKLEVMLQNLVKCENSNYNLTLRALEFPDQVLAAG